MDYQIIKATPEDTPGLKDLWLAVFDDGEAVIDAFMDQYFRPGMAVRAAVGGSIAGAGYLVPTGELYLADGASQSAAMLYAIAVRPEYRGVGVGTAITKALTETGLATGFSTLTLHPASDGLFDFYSKRLGFEEQFGVFEATVSAADIPRPHGLTLSPASYAEYGALRERFLRGRAHIRLNDNALEYFEWLCAFYRGGLFKVLRGGRDAGCAAVMAASGRVYVRELLAEGAGPISDSIGAVAALFLPPEIEARFPCWLDNDIGAEKRRFSMVFSSTNAPEDDIGWYGPEFE